MVHVQAQRVIDDVSRVVQHSRWRPANEVGASTFISAVSSITGSDSTAILNGEPP